MTRYDGFPFLSLRGGPTGRRGNPSSTPNSSFLTHHSLILQQLPVIQLRRPDDDLVSGAEGVAVKRFNYSGPQDCQAAMLFGGKSNKECRFACIGLGNCARACKFGAMHIVNGVAKVDRDKCVGCMACADACPKKIIERVPYKQAVLVACRNQDKGAA